MTLNIKLIRDFLSKIGSNVAIILLISIGALIFASFALLKINMQKSVEDFYLEGNIADGYINLRSIAYSKAEYIREIEGIDDAQGRIVNDFKVSFENSKDNVSLKIVSYKRDDTINKFILEKGEYPKNGNREIVLDSKFAQENRLDIGDTVEITTDEDRLFFRVCGLGASPQFSYLVKNKSDIMPDYTTYGCALTGIKDMEILSKVSGSYNDIIFTVDDDVNFTELKSRLSIILKEYGVTNIYEKDSQFSYMMMESEIEEMTAMSILLPVVFLTIAALIEFMMVERLVKSQRGQIGVLKAFGYDNITILIYYIKYSLIIGFVGAVLGLAFSLPLLNYMIDMYRDYFNIPKIYNDLEINIFLAGIFFAMFFSFLAGYTGAKDIIKLNPVEAMKPEEPASSQNSSLVDKFLFIFDTLGRMSLRNTFRNKKRTVFIFLGITLTFALTSMTFIVTYVVEDMIFDRYNYVEKYDGKINFKTPVSSSKALFEIYENSKIMIAQSLLEAPVTIYHKNLSKDTVITGTDNHLYTVIDKKNNKIDLGEDDFKISERLADILDIKVGDKVNIKSVFAKDDDYIDVVVTDIVKQNLGMGIYMKKKSLEDLLGLKDVATSVIFKSDKATIEDIREKYEDSHIVSSIDDKEKIKENVSKSRESFDFLTYVFAFLGVMMGFIVVYNSYIVSINERQRELSSMMVLGFSKKEVSYVVSLEQWLITFVAVICGVPISKLIMIFLSWGVSSDMMTLPTDLKPIGFVIGLFCTFSSVIIAQIVGYKKLENLSIVEVLKERE